jgi:hypothetical protein
MAYRARRTRKPSHHPRDDRRASRKPKRCPDSGRISLSRNLDHRRHVKPGFSTITTATLAARPHLYSYGNIHDELCPARTSLNTKLPMRLFS